LTLTGKDGVQEIALNLFATEDAKEEIEGRKGMEEPCKNGDLPETTQLEADNILYKV
jgi:hypothetical protein